MSKKKKRLGEILIEANLIDESILMKVLSLQKETGLKIGEILTKEKYLTEEQILEAIQNQLKIPSIDLNKINIRQEIIDLLPDKLVRKHMVIPVDVVNGQLMIVMSDPLNHYAIEDIRAASGMLTKVSITLKNSILENIERYYGKNKAAKAIKDYSRTYGQSNLKDRKDKIDKIDEDVAPVIKFINSIIENAMLNGASDIHFEPQEHAMRIRIRIDGVLQEMMTSDLNMHEAVISRIKIMSNLNIAEHRIPQDGKIEYNIKGKKIDLRISIVNAVWGEKVVMRILDKSNVMIELDQLGLDESNQQRFNHIINQPHGIILVCGPTGSGKTTTLYSILNKLNDVSKNIITIEDPVEYNFESINQLQVNPKIGFEFTSGLRAILRQDPDIIMVGEIRDADTAEISIRSALTGHLVLSTIHTNNSIGTITRLKDMGIKPFLLSSTIVGVVAQRLVRKVCFNCGEEHVTDTREMKLLDIDKPTKIREGKGCRLCNNTGYKGRVAVFEVLQMTNDLRIMIDEGISESEIEIAAKKSGMSFLRQSCINKVIEGVITLDEMLRVTYSQR